MVVPRIVGSSRWSRPWPKSQPFIDTGPTRAQIGGKLADPAGQQRKVSPPPIWRFSLGDLPFARVRLLSRPYRSTGFLCVRLGLNSSATTGRQHDEASREGLSMGHDISRRRFMARMGAGATTAAIPALLARGADAGWQPTKTKPILGSWISVLWSDRRHHYWNDTCAKFSRQQWEESVKEVAGLGMQYLVLLSNGSGSNSKPCHPTSTW